MENDSPVTEHSAWYDTAPILLVACPAPFSHEHPYILLGYFNIACFDMSPFTHFNTLARQDVAMLLCEVLA